MVKVIDKRPTDPKDSLRRLLNGIKTPASVPHGIKVAGPNDYVSFMDSGGVSHRWDGDAIATYNTRLAEAEVAMAEAKAELDEAKAELEAAKDRIDASSGDLTAYIEKVEAAQAKADAVQASFEGMAGELDTVAEAVESVKARTTTVEGETGRLSSAVETALAEASAASSLASEAGNKAEAAAAEAAKVQALAQNASAAVEEAERKALEAAGIAAGKGKVIYGGTAPTGSDATSENLWIRSSDNRPHRWDGTRWVEVTDAAVVASAAAASAAQAKADKAERDAAAAQATADQAKRDAAAAQAAAVTADGKASQAISAAQAAQGTADKALSDAAKAQTAANAADRKALDAAGLAGSKGKVIYSATAPTGAEQVGQNLWIRTTDNRPHRWSGSAWVAVTDKTATDAAASAAAANSLASQAKAAADKAQADATSAATAAQDAMRAANQAQDSANGKNTVSYTTGTPAGVGTRLGDTHYQVNAAGTVLRWWRWSGTAWVEQALDGQVISSLDAGKITAGTLDAARIKAGSITGDKINAQSVAAAVGTFVKVNAENVGVSGELAARVVNAMTAQVKNLVVTESAILQHSTLLGNTTAEQLNVTKKLVARDAIVDGTLDVAQLNVTEQMAAEIVNAMSVNAKKLVVTEDAIMNQLTVIQNIVTPELVAERINVKNLGAALVTAGALQTDDAANRGVKITSAGINAWDTTGRQTLRLNGADNLLTGQLATGDETVGRIKLFNATHPVNGRPAGFITIHDTGGTTGKQGVVEYNSGQLMLSVKDGTEGGYSQPFRKGLLVAGDGATLVGDLRLDGQFKKSPAFRAHSISLGNIPVGHYTEARQPFTKVNGQRPYSVIQVASSNFANLNAVNWTNDDEVVIRIYNNSDFEARNVYADTILLGLER